MPVSGHQTKAFKALRERLDAGDTGRLNLGRGNNRVSVYLMAGQVVGAEASDDIRHLLRRLLLGGYVTAGRSKEILAMAAADEPYLGTLLDEVNAKVIDPILEDRFVDNVARALAFNGKPHFTHMPAVFLDNFQMGHDTQALVLAAADCIDAARTVDLDLDLEPGPAAPRTSLEKAFVARLGKGMTVGNLVLQVPAEPNQARALIREMIDGGTLRKAGETDDELLDLPIDEPLRNDNLSAALAEEIEVEDEAMQAEPKAAPDPAEDLATEEVTTDDPTTIEGAGNLKSLEAWMDHGVDVEADLEAFSDHEQERGGGKGGFTTQEHNLDKVEVGDISGVIAVDEAPSAKYGAPVLSEDAALAKVTVTNNVLSTIVTAFDGSHGNGRGQAAVQLLIDGSPNNFQPLFEGIQANEGGSLPDEAVLRNLYRRPPAEHRTLLHQGLLNLIDRALSMACDDLPDEAVDEVLESTAGYRQRMGI